MIKVFKILTLTMIIVMGCIVIVPTWNEQLNKVIFEHNQPKVIFDFEKYESKFKTKTNNSSSRPRVIKHLNAAFPSHIFSDVNFRNCLIATHKRNPESIKNLSCSGQSIKSIVGLRKLVNLKWLDLSNNQIDHIELLPQQQLKELNVSHNKLYSLSLASEALEKLNFTDNEIQILDIGNTPELKELKVRNNKLRFLSLDTPNLKILDAAGNDLDRIKLEQPNKLETLILSNNHLAEFDFNNLDRLKYIDLRNNRLQKLVNNNVDKYFTMFIGGNDVFSNRGGFDLTFEKARVISSDLSEVDFPDPVLRDCVVLNLKSSLKEIETLNCYIASHYIHTNKKIKDVSGLEQLSNLKRLSLINQDITSIDLSSFQQLNYVDLSGNKLTEIILNENPLLETGIFSGNEITDLNVDSDLLKELNVSNNNLEKLNLSKLKNLKSLKINNNQLDSIDLSAQEKLRVLEVEGNQLNKIDLEEIPYLRSIKLSNNPWSQESYLNFKNRFYKSTSDLDGSMFKGQLIFIEKFNADKNIFPDPAFRNCVSEQVRDLEENSVTALKSLDCQYRLIRNFSGIETLSQLKRLSINSGKLDQLNLSKFKDLFSLRLRNTKIKHLDLNGTTSLKVLDVQGNKIQSINFDPNHDLIHIEIQNNQIQTLNIHSMPSLKKLFANDNQIKEFKHGIFPEMTLLKLSNNYLPTLQTNSFGNLKYLYLDNNYIKDIKLDSLKKLETLVINDNLLEHLDWSGLEKLEGAYIFGNQELKPEITGAGLEYVRVDSVQFEHMKKTGQLPEYEHVDNYQTNRYFLKRTLD